MAATLLAHLFFFLSDEIILVLVVQDPIIGVTDDKASIKPT